LFTFSDKPETLTIPASQEVTETSPSTAIQSQTSPSHMQSIMDQTTRMDFQQKQICEVAIFHLANVCQPKTLICNNNKVYSSTLLFKHEIVPNVSFKMQEAQG